MPTVTQPAQYAGLGVEAAVFRHEGDYWTIAYDGAIVRIRDAKGLRYLEQLLRNPGKQFHVDHLIGLAAGAARAVDAPASDAAERARKSVTNRIRQSVARIRAAHATLGIHLQNSIRTGMQCGYTPERFIRWDG